MTWMPEDVDREGIAQLLNEDDYLRCLDIFNACYPNGDYLSDFTAEMERCKKRYSGVIGQGGLNKLETLDAIAYYANNRVVGVLTYELCAFDSAILSICNIVVDPRFQNIGIGKKLIGHTYKVAKLYECDLIMASTLLPEYYERLGFYKLPTHRKHWFLMAKTISENY